MIAYKYGWLFFHWCVYGYILRLSSQPKISKYKNKPPVYQKHKLETILIIIFNYIRNNFLPFLAKPATPNESPAVNTYNKPLCVSPVWTLVGDTVSFFACDILSWFATLLETFSFADVTLSTAALLSLALLLLLLLLLSFEISSATVSLFVLLSVLSLFWLSWLFWLSLFWLSWFSGYWGGLRNFQILVNVIS